MISHILNVVGARPNFMKAAPVIAALKRRGIHQTLIHTGQHYDSTLSHSIFQDLQLPEPDMNLGVGSGTHADQTARVLSAMERCLLERSPDMVLVYGDVNSTLAATLASAKLGIPVGHIESGLRSGDRSMPEEINRLVTDRLASLLFTPSADADSNLLAEGIDAETIKLVGNVMIDTLVRLLPVADPARMLKRFALANRASAVPFVLVTLHRPSNVDDPASLARLVAALADVASDAPVIFPVHPRTRARVEAQGISWGRITAVEPLTYLEFLSLQRCAAVVITDSGGIQEETTFLRIPCLTMRETTERPITVTLGTNQLIGTDTERMKTEAKKTLSGQVRNGVVPPLWDGNAAERIADHIAAL